MTFNELLRIAGSKNTGVKIDSRQVKNGDIFVAIRGTNCDGHDFINKALQNWAKFIVCEKPVAAKDAEVIQVKDSSEAAAVLAQAAKGNPASKLTNLAVTGTNGKTTVTFLVRCCVQAMGKRCGLIGTIAYDTGTGSSESSLTTPDCLTIADAQAQMVKGGVKYMVIEASSHALSQNRLAGINFKAAAFTNLTGDHLDYHRTEKEYLAAKSVLFEKLSADAMAVLNKESAQSEIIAGKTRVKKLWYAIDRPADLTAHIESMDITGTTFTLEYAGKKEKVMTPLLGRYNISNHLAAAGLCIGAGLNLETIAKGLSQLKAVPGRLERIEWGGDFSVLVDFAHTDDALKNVLSTLKPLCKGRLYVVFGCGGNRDRTKRPRMAKVAEELADLIFVTSDNPRKEEPAEIIGEIVTGFKNPAADNIRVDVDRKKAIEKAIRAARKDDIVVIAGKGHENYQIIGEKKNEFSDRQAACEYLAKLK